MIGQSWVPLQLTGTASHDELYGVILDAASPELYILAHLLENEESVLQCTFSPCSFPAGEEKTVLILYCPN